MTKAFKVNEAKKISLAAFAIFFWAAGLALGKPRHFMPGGFGGLSVPALPGENARVLKQIHIDNEARAALDTGDYAAEENYARQSLALGLGTGLSQQLLAQSLKDQGKGEEALQVYKVIIMDQNNSDENNLLPFALLLLKAGKWTQAVTIYNLATTRMVNANTLMASGQFSQDVPQPKHLEVAIHIAQGVLDQHSAGWSHHVRLAEGMSEFVLALQLQPKAALTNYYFGYGLKRLGRQAEAQAAFRKAAALGQGDVKAAAQKELPLSAPLR